MEAESARSAEADELAIRNLLARIAHAADQGTLDDYVALFTHDASWELPDGNRKGRADIKAGAEDRRGSGLTGPGSSSRHVITTIEVQMVDSHRAIADSYFIFYRETMTNPTVFNMGQYHDELRFDDGGWRLARRQITFG